jgi:hypothetical protein
MSPLKTVPVRCIGDSSFGMKKSGTGGYTATGFSQSLAKCMGRAWDNTTTVNSISGGTMTNIKLAILKAFESEPDARVCVSWQFNDVVNNSWKYAGCPEAEWFHEVRRFALDMIGKRVIFILGSEAKLWGLEEGFDRVVHEVRQIFTQCGVPWVDGTPLFTAAPRKDMWHAAATEENKDLFAGFVLKVIDVAELMYGYHLQRTGGYMPWASIPRKPFEESVETVMSRVQAFEQAPLVPKSSMPATSSWLPRLPPYTSASQSSPLPPPVPTEVAPASVLQQRPPVPAFPPKIRSVAAVLSAPRLTRTAPRASEDGTPIASST